jgi:hypothetical protein
VPAGVNHLKVDSGYGYVDMAVSRKHACVGTFGTHTRARIMNKGQIVSPRMYWIGISRCKLRYEARLVANAARWLCIHGNDAPEHSVEAKSPRTSAGRMVLGPGSGAMPCALAGLIHSVTAGVKTGHTCIYVCQCP